LILLYPFELIDVCPVNGLSLNFGTGILYEGNGIEGLVVDGIS
jgi:hypothetical protein